jgi:hypothetical protein
MSFVIRNDDEPTKSYVELNAIAILPFLPSRNAGMLLGFRGSLGLGP